MNDKVILLQWDSANGALVAIVALEGPAAVDDSAWRGMEWIASSEDPRFTADPAPIAIGDKGGEVKFARAGAILFASGDLLGKDTAADEKETATHGR